MSPASDKHEPNQKVPSNHVFLWETADGFVYYLTEFWCLPGPSAKMLSPSTSTALHSGDKSLDTMNRTAVSILTAGLLASSTKTEQSDSI